MLCVMLYSDTVQCTAGVWVSRCVTCISKDVSPGARYQLETRPIHYNNWLLCHCCNDLQLNYQPTNYSAHPRPLGMSAINACNTAPVPTIRPILPIYGHPYVYTGDLCIYSCLSVYIRLTKQTIYVPPIINIQPSISIYNPPYVYTADRKYL